MSVYMITHKMTWLLQEIRNIYYYETQTGNPTAAEWQDICDEIYSNFDTYLDNLLSPDWSFWGIDYRLVDTPGYNTFEAVPTAGALDGSGIVDDTATQLALLVSVKGVTLKPNKCRTYLGGFVESNMGNSLWDDLAMSKSVDFISNQLLLNQAGTNVLERNSVTWNSSHTQVVANNSVLISAVKASKVPATQRRRRIGVGI